MPSRTPSEAINAYLQPLQRALSCFSKTVLRTSAGYTPGIVQLATFPEVSVDLITHRQEILSLSFIQSFVLENPTPKGFKVRTLSYMYSLDNSEGKEILGFHWHPDATPANPILYPHLHIGAGSGTKIRDEIQAIHFRTDRIAFEDLGLMLIQEFGVTPDRNDAIEVLSAGLQIFQQHRTWHTFVPAIAASHDPSDH